MAQFLRISDEFYATMPA